MSKRTYLDASLLIAAWQAKDDTGVQALAILDDPNRELIVSDAVWLEVMPKPLYHKQHNEQVFYQAIFDFHVPACRGGQGQYFCDGEYQGRMQLESQWLRSGSLRWAGPQLGG